MVIEREDVATHRCSALDLLRLIPVCPKSCGAHTLQAPLLAYLRPGLWVQRCLGLRMNWKRERWLIHDTKSSSEVMSILRTCESIRQQPTSSTKPQMINADFVVHRVTDTFFCCFFFTHYRQWLDVVEISLQPSTGGDAPLVASAFSFSASVVPAASPLAVLQAILFAWIPFSDMGQNALHLRALRKLLNDQGRHVEVEADERARL